MNLHGIVGPVIAAVNPTIVASFYASQPPSTGVDGKRTPAFAAPVQVPAQVQAIASLRELQQIEGLNLGGQRATGIYLYGTASGTVRVSQKGGDKIVVATGPAAGTYIVVAVLEQWLDWVKVAGVLQNGS